MKKISFLLLVILLLACLVGCGESSPVSSEQVVTNTAILALLSNYEAAVEAYNVKNMLACLDSTFFELTINEGSYKDTKKYSDLKADLEADEAKQLAWRKSPAEDPNGHNYKLELKILGSPTSSNETSTGAVVRQIFQVWESSDEINPATLTDSGTIVWTLVQSSGMWKATAMVINYSTVKSAVAVKGLTATKAMGNGFEFGRVGF